MSLYIQLNQRDSIAICALIIVIYNKDSNHINIKIHFFLNTENSLEAKQGHLT